MSGDKRSVHTDAFQTLGTIIKETEVKDGEKDAIHLAVYQVVAGENLCAGEKIGLVNGQARKARGEIKALGIVDPFIEDNHGNVRAGQYFWLIVFPRQITSLRHVWSHPDFLENVKEKKAPAKKKIMTESEKYIRDLAKRVGITYEVLMEGAADYLDDKRGRKKWASRIIGGSMMEGEGVPQQFWPHYEKVTGTRIPDKFRGSFFSCAC